MEDDAAPRVRTRVWDWALIVVLGVLGLATAADAATSGQPWSVMGSSLQPTSFSALEAGDHAASEPSISDARRPSDGGTFVYPYVTATVDLPESGLPVIEGTGLFGDWSGRAWWAASACGTIGCEPLVDGAALSSSTQVGPWTDGAAVAFATTADDVAGMDVDEDGGCADAERCADVFLDGMADPPHRGRLSVGPGSASSDSTSPSLAAVAPIVAFTSTGTGLVPEDVGTAADVYVAEVVGADGDLLDVVLELVSVPAPGGSSAGGSSTSGENAISDDGSVVAFTTTAALVPEDVNGDVDVYVRDRQGGTTELVSRLGTGAGGQSHPGSAAVSGDGLWVAFATQAALAPGDTNGVRDVYLVERATGVAELVSREPGGPPGDAPSEAPALNGDASIVALQTESMSLVDAAEGPDDLDDVPYQLPQVVLAHIHDGRPLELLTPARYGGATDGAGASPASWDPDLGGDGPFLGNGMVAFVAVGNLGGSAPSAVPGIENVWTTFVLWPTCDPERFTDVGPGRFCAEISVAAREDLVAGYPDGTFRPGLLVSRQAVAAFLYRAAGHPEGPDPTCTEAPFPDVPVDHPFCGEISWLAEEGITTGYADGTFRPGVDLSRGAYVTFLHRSEGSPEGWTCPPSAFPDVADDSLFCEPVRWGEATGRVDGYDDGSFRPAAPVSRQAAVAILVGQV